LFVVVEGLGNAYAFVSEGFGSTAFFPSGTGCCQSSLSSFPNEVSLKLRQCAEDMEDQLAATDGIGEDLRAASLG
jgi:hypothetical protein